MKEDTSCGSWEWKDMNGHWCTYNQATSDRIEKLYKSRRDKSCLITRDGES